MKSDIDGEIEALEINEDLNSKEKNEDIAKVFFKPIDEIQAQQETLIQSYEKDLEPVVPPIFDLSNEVRTLENKLNRKKLYIPFLYVLFIIIVINLIWFLSMKFYIVPKYENYVKQSQEIKQNYDDLKRKVDAIVGE